MHQPINEMFKSNTLQINDLAITIDDIGKIDQRKQDTALVLKKN